jgi:hypothetical protein
LVIKTKKNDIVIDKYDYEMYQTPGHSF